MQGIFLITAVLALTLALHANVNDTAPKPLQRHTVLMPVELETHSKAESKAWKLTVDRLRNDLTQVTLAKPPDNGEYAYLEVTLVTEERPDKLFDVDISARFVAPTRRPLLLRRHCEECTLAAVNRLMRRIVQASLFTGEQPLYAPVAIEKCSVADDGRSIEVTIAPANGVGIEPNIYYAVRLAGASADSLLLLGPAGSTLSDVQAKFSLVEQQPTDRSSNEKQLTDTRLNFIDKCRKNSKAFVFVPRLIPPGDETSRNDNAPSVVQ